MKLTTRATVILGHLAAGLSMQESAALLGISYNVVEAHMSRARRDHHCKTTIQLVALWARGGLPYPVPVTAPDLMAGWQRSYQRRHQNESQQT